METKRIVDLLRMTLIARGHVKSTNYDSRKEGTCVLTNGEYLVSLMSHDRSLDHFLLQYEGNLLCDIEPSDHFLRVRATDFDSYVDLVKFIWLEEGVQAAIDYTSHVGFSHWVNCTSRLSREQMVDDAVSRAYSKLRSAGVKHREAAEFFSDRNANASLAGEVGGEEERSLEREAVSNVAALDSVEAAIDNLFEALSQLQDNPMMSDEEATKMADLLSNVGGKCREVSRGLLATIVANPDNTTKH